MALGHVFVVATLVFSSNKALASFSSQELDSSEELDSEEQVHVQLGRWLLDQEHTRLLLEFQVPAISPPEIWSNGAEIVVTLDGGPPSEVSFLQLSAKLQTPWFDNELHALKLQAAGNSSMLVDLLEEWREHEVSPEVQGQVDEQLESLRQASHAKPSGGLPPPVASEKGSARSQPSQLSKASHLTTTKALAYPLTGDDVEALQKQGAFLAASVGSETGSIDRMAIPPYVDHLTVDHVKVPGTFVPDVSAMLKVALGGDRWAVVLPLKSGTTQPLKKGKWQRIHEASDEDALAVNVILKPVSQELPASDKNSKDGPPLTTTTTTTTKAPKPARVADVLNWLKGGLSKDELSNNVPLDDWPTPSVGAGAGAGQAQVDTGSDQQPIAASTPLDDWPTPNVPAAKPKGKADWLNWHPMSADAAVAAVAAGAGSSVEQPQPPAQQVSEAPPEQQTAKVQPPPPVPKSKAEWLAWKPMSADAAVEAVTGEPNAPLTSADKSTNPQPDQATSDVPLPSVAPKSKADWLSWKPMNADAAVASVTGEPNDPLPSNPPNQVSQDIPSAAPTNALTPSKVHSKALLGKSAPVKTQAAMPAPPMAPKQDALVPAPAVVPSQPLSKNQILTWRPMSADDMVASVEGESGDSLAIDTSVAAPVPAAPKQVEVPAAPQAPPKLQTAPQPVPSKALLGKVSPVKAPAAPVAQEPMPSGVVAAEPMASRASPLPSGKPLAAEPVAMPAAAVPGGKPLAEEPVAMPAVPSKPLSKENILTWRPMNADDLVASVEDEAATPSQPAQPQAAPQVTLPAQRQPALQAPQARAAVPLPAQTQPAPIPAQTQPAPQAPQARAAVPVPQSASKTLPSKAPVAAPPAVNPSTQQAGTAQFADRLERLGLEGTDRTTIEDPSVALRGAQSVDQNIAKVTDILGNMKSVAAPSMTDLVVKDMPDRSIVQASIEQATSQAADQDAATIPATPTVYPVPSAPAKHDWFNWKPPDSSAAVTGVLNNLNLKGGAAGAPVDMPVASTTVNIPSAAQAPVVAAATAPIAPVPPAAPIATAAAPFAPVLPMVPPVLPATAPGPVASLASPAAMRVASEAIQPMASAPKPTTFNSQDETTATTYPVAQPNSNRNWFNWKPPDSSAEVANVLSSLNAKGSPGGQSSVATEASLPGDPALHMLPPGRPSPQAAQAPSIERLASAGAAFPNPKFASQPMNSITDEQSALTSGLPMASQTFASQFASGTESGVNWKSVPGTWAVPSSPVPVATSPVVASSSVSQVVPQEALPAFASSSAGSITGASTQEVASATPPAANDPSGLTDLAKVDPNSFSIVKALLAKRNQGKLPLSIPQPAEPTESSLNAVSSVPETQVQSENWKLAKDDWSQPPPVASASSSVSASPVDLALSLSSSPAMASSGESTSQPDSSAFASAASALGLPQAEPRVTGTKDGDETAVHGLLEQVARLTGKHVHRHEPPAMTSVADQQQEPAHTENAKWGDIVESDPGMRILNAAESLR
jgi:hypothetical protein